jgi:hypothetical protein
LRQIRSWHLDSWWHCRDPNSRRSGVELLWRIAFRPTPVGTIDRAGDFLLRESNGRIHPMVWNPTKVQLEVIAEMTTARMSLDRIVKVLEIAPADFLAWRIRVVAATVAEELSVSETPRQIQRSLEQRLPRVRAEQIFGKQA